MGVLVLWSEIVRRSAGRCALGGEGFVTWLLVVFCDECDTEYQIYCDEVCKLYVFKLKTLVRCFASPGTLASFFPRFLSRHARGKLKTTWSLLQYHP